MSNPVIAQKSPYEIVAKEGQSYAWCRCGLSQKQPFCDGAHTTTDLKPIVWKMMETKTIYLCGCKHSQDKPYCDGTHNSL